ncbi:MAG: non-reducing end alpha-L-arabinofuranosidase family hydrolase [Verrucomicrobiota bacterium]
MNYFFLASFSAILWLTVTNGEDAFSWTTGAPVIDTSVWNEPDWVALKDPTIVFHDGAYHLFCTLRGDPSWRALAIAYTSFDDFGEAQSKKPVILPNHATTCAAPQVFFFEPHGKWYLICQASKPDPDGWKFQAAYGTTSDLTDPESWTDLKPMEAIKPEAALNKPHDRWLDFWVIREGDTMHLFFTSDNGKMWREETTVDDFPYGWSEPELAFEGEIFEGQHIYYLPKEKTYLAVIEENIREDRRYYQTYTAETLSGEWTPLAATLDRPFAAATGKGKNVAQPDGWWTDSVSHGELIRTGVNEFMEAEMGAPFFFQGVLAKDRRGKGYGMIPWKLGVLQPAE